MYPKSLESSAIISCPLSLDTIRLPNNTWSSNAAIAGADSSWQRRGLHIVRVLVLGLLLWIWAGCLPFLVGGCGSYSKSQPGGVMSDGWLRNHCTRFLCIPIQCSLLTTLSLPLVILPKHFRSEYIHSTLSAAFFRAAQLCASWEGWTHLPLDPLLSLPFPPGPPPSPPPYFLPPVLRIILNLVILDHAFTSASCIDPYTHLLVFCGPWKHRLSVQFFVLMHSLSKTSIKGRRSCYDEEYA